MTTQAQIAQMRKVAFYTGVARYLHLNRDVAPLLKHAGVFDDVAKLGTIAAVGTPVLSYLAGRHAGRFAGGMLGNASSPSATTVGTREYDLARAATQRMIDELNADRVNKEVGEVIDNPEDEEKKPPRPFASPSLLRYGR